MKRAYLVLAVTYLIVSLTGCRRVPPQLEESGAKVLEELASKMGAATKQAEADIRAAEKLAAGRNAEEAVAMRQRTATRLQCTLDDLINTRTHVPLEKANIGNRALLDDSHRLVSQHKDLVFIQGRGHTEVLSLKKISPRDLKDRIPNPRRVVIQGRIGHELSNKLEAADVRVVRDLFDYLKEPLIEPQRIELIFIGSKEETVATRIFEGQSVDAIKRAMEEAEKIGGIVETPAQLADCLSAARKANARPVVVFHNGKAGITFKDGTTMTLEQFGARFGKRDPVAFSCNTYRASAFSYQTTATLDLNSTVEALKKAKLKYGNEVVPFDEFLDLFVRYYNRAELVNKLYLVGGVGVGASGLGIAIYGGRAYSTSTANLP
jgi:hypothetical protein